MNEKELKAAVRYGLRWYCIFWAAQVLVLGLVIHLAIVWR